MADETLDAPTASQEREQASDGDKPAETTESETVKREEAPQNESPQESQPEPEKAADTEPAEEQEKATEAEAQESPASKEPAEAAEEANEAEKSPSRARFMSSKFPALRYVLSWSSSCTATISISGNALEIAERSIHSSGPQ